MNSCSVVLYVDWLLETVCSSPSRCLLMDSVAFWRPDSRQGLSFFCLASIKHVRKWSLLELSQQQQQWWHGWIRSTWIELFHWHERSFRPGCNHSRIRSGWWTTEMNWTRAAHILSHNYFSSFAKQQSVRKRFRLQRILIHRIACIQKKN